MIISEHYLGYPKKTLIVVTNNELAKIFSAFERDVEELAVIEMETEKPEARATGTPNAAAPDLDEIKQHIRGELYSGTTKNERSWTVTTRFALRVGGTKELVA